MDDLVKDKIAKWNENQDINLWNQHVIVKPKEGLILNVRIKQ
jgi:hypothetical protein